MPLKQELPAGVNNEGELQLKAKDKALEIKNPKEVEGLQAKVYAENPEAEEEGFVTQWGWEQEARRDLNIPYGVPNLQGLSADHDIDYADANALAAGTFLNSHKARETAFFGMPSDLLALTHEGRKVQEVREAQLQESKKPTE